MTKERGILFSSEMVARLLSGEKTQTRRAVKVQPPDPARHYLDRYAKGPEWAYWVNPPDNRMVDGRTFPCPYGVPGDRLVCRETWGIANDGSDRTIYRADYLACPACNFHHEECTCSFRPPVDKWRPSIHLPRVRARIVLEITDVRVERVQSISEADAKAEGADSIFMASLETFARGGALPPSTHRNGFGALWRRINGVASWESDPWCWCLTFKRVTP